MKVLTLSALLSVALGVASAHAGDILRSKALGDLRSDRARGFADVIPEGQGLFLVQWKNAPKEAEKAEVSSLGLRLLSYFPDDAFLAQGEGSAEIGRAHV